MLKHGITFFLCIMSFYAQADTLKVGRYYAITTDAVPAQYFPLQELKTINMSHQIDTISKAVDYLIQGTGYVQADSRARSTADNALMEKPLANINRQFDNATILEMLRAVAGLGYVVVVDPLNKLIAYEVDNGFAQ